MITVVSMSRWDLEAPDAQRRAAPRARFGGFLESVDLFDAQIFSMSSAEAELTDPQQRLLLEVPRGSQRNGIEE
jgi:acyl transferase domain-containing protein